MVFARLGNVIEHDTAYDEIGGVIRRSVTGLRDWMKSKPLLPTRPFG
jgi:hypothetical protein